VVAINYGGNAGNASVAGLAPDSTLPQAYPAGGEALETNASGQASVSVPGQSVRVYAAP
jgi:hypothetical protein